MPKQIFSSPAVKDGVVYFHVRDDHVYALDARDGSLVWQVKFGGRSWNGLRYSGMRATPIFVDGKIFMGG